MNIMLRAALALLLAASALSCAAAQKNSDVKWVHKDGCTKPDSHWRIRKAARCTGPSHFWKYQVCWKAANLKLACQSGCNFDASAPGCVRAAPVPPSPAPASSPSPPPKPSGADIVWVNRTSIGDTFHCNVTCLNYGQALYQEPGWVAVTALQSLVSTTTEAQVAASGPLCRGMHNGKYYTGYETDARYSPEGASIEDMKACLTAVVPLKMVKPHRYFECACARGCTTPDCGIWKEGTACGCESGCACGGFFKSNIPGFTQWDNYMIGFTPKGANASECAVEMIPMFGYGYLPGAHSYYWRIPTMHIGACAGAN